jgi:hypothetical protein
MFLELDGFNDRLSKQLAQHMSRIHLDIGVAYANQVGDRLVSDIPRSQSLCRHP